MTRKAHHIMAAMPGAAPGPPESAAAKQGTEAVRWADVIRKGNLTFN